VPDDNEVLDYPTPFRSRQWEFGDDDNVLGEVTATRQWRNGSPVNSLAAGEPIGSASMWADGFSDDSPLSPGSLFVTFDGVTDNACPVCSLFFNSSFELEYIGNCQWRYVFQVLTSSPCWLKQMTFRLTSGGCQLQMIRNQLPTIEVFYFGPIIFGPPREALTMVKVVGGAACNWPLQCTVSPSAP